jgi:hypothetical protein
MKLIPLVAALYRVTGVDPHGPVLGLRVQDGTRERLLGVQHVGFCSQAVTSSGGVAGRVEFPDLKRRLVDLARKCILLGHCGAFRRQGMALRPCPDACLSTRMGELGPFARGGPTHLLTRYLARGCWSAPGSRRSGCWERLAGAALPRLGNLVGDAQVFSCAPVYTKPSELSLYFTRFNRSEEGREDLGRDEKVAIVLLRRKLGESPLVEALLNRARTANPRAPSGPQNCTKMVQKREGGCTFARAVSYPRAALPSIPGPCRLNGKKIEDTIYP